MKRLLWQVSIFLGFSLLSANEPFYYFIPPAKWDIVDPTKLKPMIKIAFVEKSGKNFKPSLNLGIQPAKVSLSEYVAAAKKQHLALRSKKWTELGVVHTKAGLAHLSQIDEKSQVGDIRSMQCIIVQEGLAYVLTAVALKEDFPNYHNDFIQAFESFSIHTTTASSLGSLELRERYSAKVESLLKEWSLFLASFKLTETPSKAFEDKRFRRGLWKDFEKFLSKDFKDKGLAWQVMASKEVKDLLLESAVSIK